LTPGERALYCISCQRIARSRPPASWNSGATRTWAVVVGCAPPSPVAPPALAAPRSAAGAKLAPSALTLVVQREGRARRS
jgi:hypothetical protein